MIKTARKIQRTTKKMVDDVLLKIVGMRVLERAKAMTESLKKEKPKKTAQKKAKKKTAQKKVVKKASKKVIRR